MTQYGNIEPQNNNLGLQVKEGRVVVSSRDVAARFEKKHYHILRDIEALECSKDFTESNFGCSDYLDSTGRKCREVLMTRDGFTFLAMGFTGARAAQFKEAYIAEFNRMEAELNERLSPKQLLNNPDFLIQVLTEIKTEKEKVKSLEITVAADQPKVLFAKAVATSQSSVLVGELAKILRQNGVQIGAKRLFAQLREQGYLGKRGEEHNMPTHAHP